MAKLRLTAKAIKRVKRSANALAREVRKGTKKTIRVSAKSVRSANRSAKKVAKRVGKQAQKVGKKATKVGKQASKQVQKAVTKASKSKVAKRIKKGATAFVKDLDRGYDALMDRLMGPPEVVKVGVFGDAADQAHTGEGNATVGQIAEWSEFGIGQPQRSWLRGYVDENRDDIQRIIRISSQRVFKGHQTQREALEKVGLYLAGGMKKRISAIIPPRNAPSTIKRKGSSTPLIDKGQFRSSISHEVSR